MWARRCGAPPAWPSRVKVLIMSFITGAVGFAVFQYMSDADAGRPRVRQSAWGLRRSETGAREFKRPWLRTSGRFWANPGRSPTQLVGPQLR